MPPQLSPRRPPYQGRGRVSPPKPLMTEAITPWRSWESAAVLLANVPTDASTFCIWRAFCKEGTISSIDLFEDPHGNRGHTGKIRFRPPPATDFWKNGNYTIVLPNGRCVSINIALELRRLDLDIQSPVRPEVRYPVELRLPIKVMAIGVMVDKSTFLPMRTVGDGNEGQAQAFMVLNLRQRNLQVNFSLPIYSNQKFANPADIYHQYRVKIPFPQLGRIFETWDHNSGCLSHLTILEDPPCYHRRVKNIASTFIDHNSWKEADTWFRQTSIVHNPYGLASSPVSLRRIRPIIDIGRWNAFKITYPKNANSVEKFTLLCNILRDYNITIEKPDKLTTWDPTRERVPPIWKWIDQDDTKPSTKPSSFAELTDYTYIPLPFSVRYQLEVCLSNGYLSEFAMTREFAVKLSELGEPDARKLLEHVATKKKVYYNPMDIFRILFVKGVTDSKIPSYCCYMRSARVTPGTIYYNTPTVDISNRVIRQYIEFADRFLRVRFTDEKYWGRINATTDNTMDEIFTRIKRALMNGIVIGDRRYEFLAFGNSQLREHGAYFFAPLPDLTAANIRRWMGDFNDIRNVARHAARLGQCFSTTRAVAGCPVQVRKIDDIERNGYTFSDGVGRISKFLAQMAVSELKIKTPTGDPPSAFQFRLGGSKGMLTVDSQALPQEVHIRNSQYKFPAKHNGLELIRWSQFSLATLNRQLIIVLSTLGVSDQAFHSKLRTMLASLDKAMVDDAQAIYLLRKYVDPNQMTPLVSHMVLDGFRKSNEPFVTSIMTLWRAWHLKYLKEKARIALDKGVCLLGCMDETATLKGEFTDSKPKEDAPYEEKLAALPEIFLQIARPETGGKYDAIEGLCIVARNPSLHPGDIRVVKAVNVPQLKHLRDVVVFPQTGDRDIPSMCSGGDLDGDDYLVIWDPELIPNEWFCTPMNYTSNRARDLDHDVTVDEITSFFVMYMKNDCLPRIAHAHLAWADRLEEGVNGGKCMRLAQLHSDAVDYNKTGNPAILTRNLVPRIWPHFMEKKGKARSQIYRSTTILGQLYDTVERVDFVPNLEMPFDKRILDCPIKPSEDLLQFAKEMKYDYDSAIRRVMAQHEIKTEFEVWTTFVLSHANMSKDYKFHEEIGAISAYLKDGFRKECYEKVEGREFPQLAPLAVAMYHITHEEMTEALNKYRAENPVDEKYFHKMTPQISDLPLISFPWLLQDVLGKIAMGHYELPLEPISKKATSGGEKDISMVPGDPLNLFADEKDVPQPSPSNGASPTLVESAESVNQLADSRFPKLQLRSNSSVVTTDGVNLLELRGGLKENAREGEKGRERGEKEKALETDEGECVELVEEESDVKPNAVDMLTRLLEGAD